MRKGSSRILLLTTLLFLSQLASAQAQDGSSSTNQFLSISLAAVIIIAFLVMVKAGNKLLQIQTKKPGLPAYVNGDAAIILKRGFDIKLKGAATGKVDEKVRVDTFAMQPPNFRGVAPIPKVEVEVGDTVKAGDHLFYDKTESAVKYVSPVSGEVIAVNRGARRSIVEVVILADKEQQYRQLPAFDPEKNSREKLVDFLLDTGGWSLLRQRPYDIVAQPEFVPGNIFISTFDTAPLAPDLNVVVEGRGIAFQKGLDVLAKLTTGKVYLGMNANGGAAPSEVFLKATGVEKRWFKGCHPAGNVGVQIHHVAPVGTKGMVWTLGVQEVITLGALFTENRFNAERVIALTGAELKMPKYVRTYAGANVKELIKDNLKSDHVRFVSGDVLSGQQKSPGNFLNMYDDQLTVLEEGDYYDMLGWLVPGKPAPTTSRSFSNFLFPNKTFKAETNLHGEKRAFVMTGQYEEVLPMDIYPQHLMKAILTNDYEKMEGLGIHELIEEDVAICEFACTSKQPLQKILRTGLEMMQEQG
ncbi:MAG: Na(+)-translocating NADH-quinone reductase subunit A [Saprospiraceae bacterium]|nr:MAG: Na(+)-translocating NADH-quinone reductase subunit A [Saprospiraceae bacterium]